MKEEIIIGNLDSEELELRSLDDLVSIKLLARLADGWQISGIRVSLVRPKRLNYNLLQSHRRRRRGDR